VSKEVISKRIKTIKFIVLIRLEITSLDTILPIFLYSDLACGL